MVRQRADETIKYAVDNLKRDFFTRDPEDIIAIWLFKDRRSYETGSRKLFSETHVSPYGYYSARHHALLMNISSGRGTLVHEIVHPFMRTNFPLCPSWFNEGLASLFEQSIERDGHITGLTNWRLAGLKKLIREHQTLPFDQLFALSEPAFYGAPEGYNRYYGQSRYLCYYLQQRGLLIKYYQEFSAHVADDPTGLRSLKLVLGEKDLGKFQAEWEQYVLGLIHTR